MSSIKDKVLKVLEKGRGEYFSGENLAKEIGVSRTSVNKAIKTLELDGYEIDAVTNKGYSLVGGDILSETSVRCYLPEKYESIKINFFKSTDSTNNEAKRVIYQEEKPSVFLADEQTGGRGRLGRTFYSPSGESIYLSLLVKPNTNMGLKITSYVAVAVCRAIESLTSKKTEIKWVNDIFCDGKKVSGILCEGVSGFESNEIDAVVIGVGINCHVKFTGELESIADNVLEDTTVTRSELAAKVITDILDILEELDNDKVMDEYRKKSMVLSKEIRYLEMDKWHEGVVTNILNDGSLEINNGEKIINSGEVTIRKK